MADLAAILDWIGVSPPVVAGIRLAAGDIQLVREVVLIPSGAWDTAVAAMR